MKGVGMRGRQSDHLRRGGRVSHGPYPMLTAALPLLMDGQPQRDGRRVTDLPYGLMRHGAAGVGVIIDALPARPLAFVIARIRPVILYPTKVQVQTYSRNYRAQHAEHG